MRFLDHTQRRTIAGRTPLDEWSLRRRDLYLTTHNTHNIQTSMPPHPRRIWTHNPSKWADTDPQLRPRGHWDRRYKESTWSIWRLWDRTSLMCSLSITNKMQRYTIFFITVNALHVSGGFSSHHQELKTVHTASGICRACLLLPLAVAANNLDIYPMLCVQFLSSWWWAEKLPETCRALTVIKNIV